MGSASFSFGDGEWFPLAGPRIDDESPVEQAQRLAHLREATRRNAERFRCPDCGMPGAMEPPSDRYHPDRCPARKPAPRCPECGAEFRHQVPTSCPLCGTDIYVMRRDQ